MSNSRVPSDADGTTSPETPASGPGTLAGLKWQPQPMVRWFDPVQLANTGIRALLSSIFGAYADKREVQAALSADGGLPTIHDYSDQEDLWIDYTADLGDGFDSTYTVAWLLGQSQLPPSEASDSPEERRRAEVLAGTRRGDVLVLGGDQVYPTASREEYSNRFAGPYEAALPYVPVSERPRLFAVPGNHDWYDGLTSFMRLFCQQRWIGGWQTRQSRSYFALKLPQRWWLLGIDIQLAADLDKPQLDYFKRVADHMQPGDQVILCTAEPAWVTAETDAHAYENLAFFEKAVLCPRKAKLMVTLTGDLHHYARYADSTGERHKITAGGGGAYLYGTHLLPKAVELPKAERSEPGVGRSEKSKTYEQKKVYPDAMVSRALRGGALALGMRNPNFMLFLGVMYTLLAWLLQGVGRIYLDGGNLVLWLSTMPLSGAGEVLLTMLRLTLYAPVLLAISALLVYSLWAFCMPDPGRPQWYRWIGMVHGLGHVVLVLMLSWLFSWVNLQVLGIGITEVNALLFLAEMILIGGPVGAFLFGLALLPGVNFNEAYSAQRIEHFKNFVRMHVEKSGALTIYPVGVDRVKRWEFDPAARSGAPYFKPRDGTPPKPRLIEDPITIPAPSSQQRVLAHAVVKESV